MLLERSATANAKPELEIFADDVKCAHGAAVGELDATGALLSGKPRHPAGRARRRLMLAGLRRRTRWMRAEDEARAAGSCATARHCESWC